MPPMMWLVGAVVATAVVLIAVSLKRGVTMDEAARGWQRGTAEVIGVRSSDGTGVTSQPRTTYMVEAVVVTADGRRARGWARGVYAPTADRWVGTTVPAWYDPASPAQFQLLAPRSPGRTALSMLPVVLLLLVVVAVFGGVGWLAWSDR